ncbi:OLC1v1014168C1 [Oldenlandia corymbosa var. corymbosa]|uniref:OLC1v1014168C1 n=1 Tax=Oldenlandia corymbosa var. corymbosa TaxID=529605 RepID=A0AAV1E062_OLDCO|nr:OLC1v1014168C1 [Oldenlandia corymbosa var. corymbosa]
MAIDMSTEISSLTTSPRISFSHDLCHTDDDEASRMEEDNQLRRDSSLLEMDSGDFDFSISNIFEAETTSAEELFSGGLIRSVQIQDKFVHASKQIPMSKTQVPQPQLPSLPPLPLVHPSNAGSKQEILKEPIFGNTESEQKNQSKSFWGIKRSCSLHCENSHKKSSFWSLPLLSRSNSTGSVPTPKQGTRENQKQNGFGSKQQKNLSGISSVSATGASLYVYPLSQQKPPLRKNYSGANANGMRISPVLNMPVPSSTISKGFGSLFRNGGSRDKKVKK